MNTTDLIIESINKQQCPLKVNKRLVTEVWETAQGNSLTSRGRAKLFRESLGAAVREEYKKVPMPLPVFGKILASTFVGVAWKEVANHLAILYKIKDYRKIET